MRSTVPNFAALPTRFGVRMPVQLHHELSAILTSAKAPQELAEFLGGAGLLEVDQVALMASDENRLEDKVFPVLKAAGVPTEGLPEQIAIKKAWM